MLKYALIFLSFAAYTQAAQTNTTTDTISPIEPLAHQQGSPLPAYMIIPPVGRAADFQQAFEQLKKEKSAGKVYFDLVDGSTLGNIIDMTLMSNSTLILFRYNSAQGIRFQVVKVEDIINLRY